MAERAVVRTPFDEHAERANRQGFYNQRVNNHSDLLSDGIVRDLCEACPPLKRHLAAGRVGYWTGVSDGIGRGRRADLLIAEPDPATLPSRLPESPSYGRKGAAEAGASPNLERRRMFGEHKSVITAHRNKGNRHDDLNNLWQQTNHDSGVISFATVMVGTSERFLNVSQGVKRHFYEPLVVGEEVQFDASGKVKKRFAKAAFAEVIERIRKADPTLQRDYWDALSGNRKGEWHKTVDRCRSIPVRPINDRSKPGYDKVLIVPMDYSNLRPARVHRDNDYFIDVDADYQDLIQALARLYTTFYGADN